MANYKVYEESKIVSVSGALTPLEESVVSLYMKQGYSVKTKRNSSGGRVSDADIIAFFKTAEDEEGKKKYLAEKNKEITDKNGKSRKAGYLVALKWFKENYKDDYKKIADSKKKK